MTARVSRRHVKPWRAGASDPFDSYSLHSLYALVMTLSDLEADNLELRDANHAFWLRVALCEAIELGIARMVKANEEDEGARPTPARESA